MSGARYLPRHLSMEDLIRTLVGEHERMRELLRQARDSAEKKDFAEVSRDLKLLDPIFRQHIADEEAQVLRLLIQELGVEGARDEIRVFQQHRPIYAMMQTISELAAKDAADLPSEQTRLNRLFDEHAAAEELKVFPKAISFVPRSVR